ncbi:MAG: hypothetical protein H0W44_03145 [Gammaproteobacteria bacterium]|nr:hypothetical protein [Gammaproteobacteria bacterium]
MPNYLIAIIALFFVGQPFVSAVETAATSKDLARLFISAEQRNALDNARARKLNNVVEAPNKTSVVPINAQTRHVKVNGIIVHPDGRREVWINGRKTQESTLPQHADQTHIKIQFDDGRQIKVEPGQNYVVPSIDDASVDNGNAAAE